MDMASACSVQMGLSSDQLAKEGGDVLLDQGQEDHSGVAHSQEAPAIQQLGLPIIQALRW